eukprot:12685995-Alexandrium_andersonii.AAC.1
MAHGGHHLQKHPMQAQKRWCRAECDRLQMLLGLLHRLQKRWPGRSRSLRIAQLKGMLIDKDLDAGTDTADT